MCEPGQGSKATTAGFWQPVPPPWLLSLVPFHVHTRNPTAAISTTAITMRRGDTSGCFGGFLIVDGSMGGRHCAGEGTPPRPARSDPELPRAVRGHPVPSVRGSVTDRGDRPGAGGA